MSRLAGPLVELPPPLPTMADSSTLNASLLGYLRTAVKLVSSQYAYTGKAFDDSTETTSVLCDAIERTLSRGLATGPGIAGMLGLQAPSFWSYVEQLEVLNDERGMCISCIRSIFSSNEERARTWVKFALNRRHIGACLSFLVGNEELTAKFYEPDCILRKKDDCEILLTLLEGLSSVQFELHLDERLQGMLPHVWPTAKSNLAMQASKDAMATKGIIPTPHTEGKYGSNAKKISMKKKQPKKRIIIIKEEVGV